MLPFLLLLVGFIFLIKGAFWLVDGAISVARALRVSDLVIGLTVVAFGTSAPELFVNLVASIEGSTDIAIGNILGSNIANILLILGISSILHPLTVTSGTVWKEIPLSVLAAVILGVLGNDVLIDGSAHSALTRIDGIVFLAFFVIFLSYSFSIARNGEVGGEYVARGGHGMVKSLFAIGAGLLGLSLGAKWIVEGAVVIAGRLGISEGVMGLTIVAVGTSLPELATSVTAAYRRNANIAVGNVVGSNIFNIFFILGVSSLIRPLPMNPRNVVDIAVVILSSLLLFFFMFTGKKRTLDRWEGILLLSLYACYIGYLFTYR